ncbi:GlxA family transcriptional regulator [Aliiroseovarius lamellibrachiae]|uniref:GlxA family transcriptional regulator n=1 Tax=Aliiroseovarius lamellibrachiae TaxID=1924933 RepID=UPI001BDFFEE0|nr:helix-turn-helix domain-containing protein [Aliiroseovarius lamellibrachiae]MBT2130525.1 helix-turn-helix domain-containing protein [Aliiroseovarius lamellibrachiae]
MPIVTIIAYEGAQKSALHGLGELFDVANRLVDEGAGQQIHHQVLTPSELGNAERTDALILPPNLTGRRGDNDQHLHRWIMHQHLAGTIICSACAGGFWLGHSGILDGRPATTHWALEADFRSQFPKVHLTPEHILVDDNDIVTAGGVMAWIDLGVHLIGRWLGPTVVSQTCRQMLIDPTGREQRNYRSFSPNMAHQNQPIRALQIWMEGHVAADLSVDALAGQAGLSVRSLHRKFSNSTGLSVNRYVQELRVEKAKGLLELTALSVSEICWQVGYQDVSAFNRLFKSTTGLSAGEYRHRFRIHPV